MVCESDEKMSFVTIAYLIFFLLNIDIPNIDTNIRNTEGNGVDVIFIVLFVFEFTP